MLEEKWALGSLDYVRVTIEKLPMNIISDKKSGVEIAKRTREEKGKK